MRINEADIMAGSVIRTSDGTLWCSCGNWQMKGVSNAYPCIPAYVLERECPQNIPKKKKIVSDGQKYVKVFGHYGLSLSAHREALYPSMKHMIYPLSFGRMVFVKRSHILDVKNPKTFRQQLLEDLEGANEVYSSLVEALGISIDDIGISGSVLAIGIPSWRHETDFSVYGRVACEKVFFAIEMNRKTGIFSKESIPPFHMPFKYKERWFDPHFSDVKREKYLQGATINVTSLLKEVTLDITDDKKGLYFPVVYTVNGRKKLVSFRSSHRGLYREGYKVRFVSLADAVIKFPSGKSETVFLSMHDEWGEVVARS